MPSIGLDRHVDSAAHRVAIGFAAYGFQTAVVTGPPEARRLAQLTIMADLYGNIISDLR